MANFQKRLREDCLTANGRHDHAVGTQMHARAVHVDIGKLGSKAETGLPASCAGPFRLGMPHLGPHGVNPGWLLREACNIHWNSIANSMEITPSRFRDRSGARVLPSVVACTVNGDATRFAEDDLCDLFLTEVPRAENGWRCQVDLINDAGKALRVEIVTSFARRKGDSNLSLERADLDACFAPVQYGAQAQRTSVIRRLGKSDRIQAEADRDPPHLSIEIEPSSHINGVGLVYFAAIHDMIARGEANAVPELLPAWALRNRRVHFFGNLDAGDRLEITSRPSVQALSPDASVVLRSFARRASDRNVIAVSESIYGP